MTSNINSTLKREDVSSSFGAPMGRAEQREGVPERLHLQHVRFVDGAYDTGGAYWGGGTPLWCAFSPVDTQNEWLIRVFVRAPNREAAKVAVLARLAGSGWAFYR